MLGRSWLEINLETITSNYEIYKASIRPNQDIMAVVKADAYGHGAERVTKRLQELGCNHFAVSNIDEAVKLREFGVNGQILILGYTPVLYADDLLRYDITQAIISKEYAEELANRGIRAQVAIDTGMNRVGIDADKTEECKQIIRSCANKFRLTGLFTHLCVADSVKYTEFTNGQIDKFKTIVESVKDLDLPYIHCMNSAGGLWCKPFGNLVRLGIILYGLKPDKSSVLPDGIKPALVWKSVISMVKKVEPGESIGYGRTYLVDKEMLVATIPTGYADGYSRLLSNKGKVFINGKYAPIVGRICMDQLMVDVSELNVGMGDEVILLGEEYDADKMADDIGSIGYEVVCNINKRVQKLYL